MKPWFSIQNIDSDSTEILIYDRIGQGWFDEDGVGAKQFANALKEIPQNKAITVRINSEGGNVFDGLAIYNQLQQRKEYVTTVVDGLAASIASVIALAGHKLTMPRNAHLMIHDPAGLVMGGSDDMRKMANLLDKTKQSIAGIYHDKTGIPLNRLNQMMTAETWMLGEEAMSEGFADEVSDAITVQASFNLSCFRRVPVALGGATSNSKQHKPDNTMDKTKIVALLKTHGVEVANDATDETLLKSLGDVIGNLQDTDKNKHAEEIKALTTAVAAIQDQINAAAKAAAAKQANDDRIAKLESKAEAERKARVTAQLQALAQNRPSLDVEEWLPLVLENEAMLKLAENFPMENMGAIRHSLSNCGNPLLEEYGKMKAGNARKDFRVQNFGEIKKQRQTFMPPQAANTIDANLLPDWLADALTVVVHNKLAALRLFSRDFGTQPMSPLAVVQARKATVGSTAQQNATNFESGDSTLAATSITVNQETVSFHILNSELNSGHRLAHLAEINANQFADVISDRWTTLVKASNYGTALTVGTGASWAGAQATVLPPIFAAAKNYSTRNLILDGSHLAYLLPTTHESFRLGEQGAYGFDLIAMQNRWTSADANTVGFICEPDAIALASGLPVSPPTNQFDSIGTVNIEGIDLTVQTYGWYNTAGRVMWASYDVMFGAAANDTTAAEVLISA